MQAELARLDGRVEAALNLYDQAADAARASGFRRDEAMANELAARHLLAANRRKAAEGYLRAALESRTSGWGARRKVVHLEEEFPQQLRASVVEASWRCGGLVPRSTIATTVEFGFARYGLGDEGVAGDLKRDRTGPVCGRSPCGSCSKMPAVSAGASWFARMGSS